MRDGERQDGGDAERVDLLHLPMPEATLFGRDDERAWLEACWNEHAQVATIVAPGGVGKSALVCDWLRGMQAEGWREADRVYGWSFYSQGTKETQTSADYFIHEALVFFGDPEPNAGSPWDKGERLARLMKRRRVLLVLDGVEPLQWGPGPDEGKIKDPALARLVKRLGEQNAGLCVITSRLAVAEVAGCAPEKCRKRDLGVLPEKAGAELLRARGVKGTEDELREAVREYRGHSLALVLLGSYLEEAVNGDVRRRDVIGPLVEDERVGEHAKRVMAAYETMFGEGSAEVGVLRMLGLFDRPATEGEIAALRAEPAVVGLNNAVVGLGGVAWNKAVAKLRRVGLVEKEGREGDGRLDAHPLVREYFGERVRREQAEAWREGNRRLYEYLKGKAKPLPETVEEMEPLYAAVVHGCRAGRSQEALDDVWWKRIRREEEGFSIIKLGAVGHECAGLSAFFDSPWERITRGLSETAEAFLLNDTSVALRALGRLQEASQLIQRAIDQAIAQQDWRKAAIGTYNLGELLQTRGELDNAIQQISRSVAFADESGDAHMCMACRAMMAAALHAVGFQKEAAVLFQEAERRQAERHGAYPLLHGVGGFYYCDLLLAQDHHAHVQLRAQLSLVLATGNDWLLDIAIDHLSLGRAHLLAAQRDTGGGITQAQLNFDAAVDGLRRAGHQDYLPRGLLARAALHTHTHAFDLAREDLDEALDLAERCGFRLHECDAHLGYARLCLAQGDPAGAADHLAKARAIVEQTGYHRRDEELAALEAEAHAMAPGPEEGSREGHKDRKERGGKGKEDVFAPSASFARNSPACSSRHASTEEPDAMPLNATFPPPLLDAYRAGKLAVLFGSGLSLAPDVKPQFPRWRALPALLLDEVGKQGALPKAIIDNKRSICQHPDLSLEGMLEELDTVVGALRRVHKYQAALTAIFRPSKPTPGDVHRALVDLDLAILATTNYDALLEHAERPGERTPYTWKDADNALADIDAGRKVLFKMHGSAENDESVIMTRREYDAISRDDSYKRIVGHLLQSYTFLLVGYGINDPLDLDLVFDFNVKAFGSATRTHYALVRRPEAAPHKDRWAREMNIHVVEYDDHGDLPDILRALAAAAKPGLPPAGRP